MAKKGQAVQLQQEINTDEEWEKLLEKHGLTVVDIYSEWCGPCSAMSANLKKIKLEVGGDNLQLAYAKSDTIAALERFRSKSEPTWMFIAGGKMVNLMFGANAPQLTQLILEELKKEAAVREGTRDREAIEISQLSPAEQVRFDAAKKIADEAARIEAQKLAEALHERRVAVANVVLENFPHLGVVVAFPHARDIVKNTLADLWEPADLAAAHTEKACFTEDILEELLYFSDFTFSEIEIANLTSDHTICFLVKSVEGDAYTGDIDKAVLNFIYGNSMRPPGDPESPAQMLRGYIPVPREMNEDEVDAIQSAASSEAKLVVPSMPSLSAINQPSGVFGMSETQMKSKTETHSKLAVLSKSAVHSKLGVHSKAEVLSEMEVQEADENEEEEEEDTIEIAGVWAPPNARTKATAIKLLFPKIYDPIALPEPVPIPPHVAIAFEAFKRKEVLDLAVEYPDDVMRYGFFSDDNPAIAKLVAKTVPKFEKIRGDAEASYGEKLVIQLSKKRSEAWCAFAQLGPTFMSLNTVEGEQQCKLFFPEDYDIPEEEEEEVVEVKKKKKKGKKGKGAQEVVDEAEKEDLEMPITTEEQIEEQVEGEGEAEGESEVEGEGEGEMPFEGDLVLAVEMTEDAEGDEADKATSPMSEEEATEG